MVRVNRRQFHRCALVGTAASLLAGCGMDAEWTVGVHPWPGYETLSLAEHFGWLPPGVVLHHGHSASDSMDGLSRGTLAAAALTLNEVVTLQCKGVPVSVVLIFNDSVGADQVVLREGVALDTRPRPLRVAVERSAVGMVVFKQWRHHLGWPSEAFELIDLAPSDQKDAWLAGTIDAAISYPPYATQLIRLGGDTVYDSSRFPGLILDVLAVRTDRTGWREGPQIQQLVAAHFKGLAHIRHSHEDAMRRIATWRQLSYRDVVSSYAGIRQPDAASNRHMLTPGGAVDTALATLLPLMNEAALIDSACRPSGLHTTQYLP